MACKIQRNNKGDIIKVLDPATGEESKIFNQIASLPHVENLEQAAQIYDEVLKANPEQKTEGFVSNATSAYLNIKDKNPKNAKGWINQLTDVQKNGGIRNVGQELNWIGFEEYLNDWAEENKSKNNNIPSQVVESYINSNKIEIVEVSKGDKIAEEEVENRYSVEDLKKLGVTFKSYSKEDYIEEVGQYYWNTSEYSGNDIIYRAQAPNQEDIVEEIQEEISTTEQRNTSFESLAKIISRDISYEDTKIVTKYSKYQLEGGENYREVLFTLPIKKQKKYSNTQVFAAHQNLNPNATIEESLEVSKSRPEEIMSQLEKGYLQAKDTELDNNYKSSHWDESNILAHIRLNERTLPNGEKVLFIEEIQSDLSQQGKKQGYQEKYEKKNLKKGDDSNRTKEDKDRFHIIDYTNNNGEIEQVFQILKSEYPKFEDAVEYVSTQKIKNESGVPNITPYKKTDQWIGMAMRRVYQMAAQEGFSRVAWVTGEQSADRYSLEKQVDIINVKPLTDGNIDVEIKGDFNTKLLVSKDGNVVKGRAEYVGKPLSEIVGKELAEKIVTQKEQTVLKDTDLKVGGEGMKTFYNSILPKVAKKEAQRFDKSAKVEVVDFSDSRLKYNQDFYDDIFFQLNDFFDKNDSDYSKGLKLLNNYKENTNTESYNNVKVFWDNQADLMNGQREDLRFESNNNFLTNIDGNVPLKQLSVSLTDKMKNTLGTSAVPTFSLGNKEKRFSNFREALDESEGNSIDLVSNGKVIASLPSSVDERTKEGAINALIQQGLLNPNKVTFNGKTYYQTTGHTPHDRTVSSEVLKETIGYNLDKDQYTIKDGLVEIRDKKTEVSEKGTTHRTIADTILNYFQGDTVLTKENKISEKNLKLNLMKILSDMGVSVTSLKQYQDRYKAKNNNVNPSAEALADVVNRVVAFKDGQLNLDNLTEEVMHLIVETLPQEQIENYSELVKNSQEYLDYAEQYREVYKGDEKLLEKEILGKILKNISLNKVENKSQSTVDRLINFIKDFFNNLKLSQNQRDQLKELNKLVEKFVIQQGENNFTEDSLNNSKQIALMYSLSDKITSTKSALEESLKNIREFRQFNPYKQYIKNTNFDELSAKNHLGVIDKFIEVSDRMIETTEAAIKEANRTDKGLVGQNYAIFTDLDSKVKEELQSLATELKKPQEHISNKQSRKIVEKLEENVQKIERLKSERTSTTKEQIDRMVEPILKQYGELEGDFVKEQLKKALAGEIADVNLVFSFFGQLHHASNPILNLISRKIWEKTMKTAQGTKEDLAKLEQIMKEKGFKAKDLDQFFNPETGYMHDAWDHKSFETVMDLVDMETFSKHSGQTFEKNPSFQEKRYNVSSILKELKKERGKDINKTKLLDKLAQIETYKQLKAKGELDNISEQQLGDYYRDLSLNQQPYEERRMSDTYYDKLEAKYKEQGITGETIAFLKNLSVQRGAIKSQSQVEDKIIYTPDSKAVLNSISKARKIKKSIYNSVGLLKTGLSLNLPKTENSVELRNGQILNLDIREDMTASEIADAKAAFDINKLDLLYIENLENQEKKQNSKALFNFLDFAQQANYNTEELIDLIETNVDINISREFYGNTEEFFLDNKDFLEENKGREKDIKTLKELYARRSSILAVNRNTISPFEIDKISNSSQEDIRDLTKEIGNLQKTLKFPKKNIEENPLAEKSLNEAYRNELESKRIEEGTLEELEFLEKNKHFDASRMYEVSDVFNKLEQEVDLTAGQERLIGDHYVKGDLLQTRLNYAKSRIYPYYTRYTPKGYKSIKKRVEQGENILEILRDINNNKKNSLELRIDPSFEENSNNEDVNQNYRHNWQGGFKQPKVGRFEDNSFRDKFGIDSDGNATKNKDLYEFRETWIESRIKGLEKMEDTSQNPFKMIQISKTTTQQLKDIVSARTSFKKKGQSILELLKELFAYRVDDQAYGVEGFESNKMIPKYYSQDLENPDDVSTDHYHTLVQFVTRANDRKAKKNVLSDIQNLYDALINSKRNSKEKTLKNTIKMVDNLIDQSIYGKVEQWKYGVNVPGMDYELDLAKVTRLFTKFVSLKNLGFNLIVPVTGFLTAQTSKNVEQWIGEKINKDSAKLANKEFGKLWKDSSNQALNINDNSEIFLIGQAFGLYDMSERSRNARYGKLQRTASKSAMSLHTLSNFGVTPRMVLTILYDNRIVGEKIEQPNGESKIEYKIMNRQQFMQDGTRNGKSEESLLAEWKVLEKSNIRQHMNFSKDGFKWKDSIKDKYKLDESYLENRRLFLTEYIQDTVSAMEGQLPNEIRTMAQRNAIGSLALLHRGYLSIFLQKRLKQKGFNTASGLIEEGSYRTLGKMIGDFTKSNDKTFLQKLKQLAGDIKPPVRKERESEKEFDNRILDYELEVRNMKRVSKEMAALMMLATAGALLFAAAEDDENEDLYMLQMGAYLTTRVLNESSTALSPSIFGDIAAVVEAPMVPYETAKEMTKVFDIFDNEEIKNGKYKGLSKGERFFIKNTFGSKGIYDMYSSDNIRSSRKVYNAHNKENLDRGTLFYNNLLTEMYKD